MAAILVPLSVLQKSYPNMCGAVLHIPLLAEAVVATLRETDELPLALVPVDTHIDRYCIADAGHKGDHILWLPAGVWIAAYEKLPPGWSHELGVARNIAFWVESGRPYPPLGAEHWV